VIDRRAWNFILIHELLF